ncbi:MAG: choice-of-anchor J domain-containing protein [Flavobacteriales bacterium]|nr:choice-of-anchor J domain-containing protein [Flavobacteriales bacterium]
MKKLIYTLILSVFATMAFVSCTKEFDDPTVKTIPTGTVMTIAEVRALHVPGQEVKITQDISVYGVVTADETSGNLYKESYIQDETGALYLRFTSSTGLYVGDSIRVNINGAKILKYNQMLQVDSLHADNSVFKIKTQQFRTPQVVTISDLLADIEGFQGKLIQLDNVRFVERNQSLTYADGVNKVSTSRFLEDLSANQIEVRTSGYANFANDTLPAGSGTFVGISAQYNTGIQLLIRNTNEVDLYGAIPVEIIKNFDDLSLTSGGWSTQYPIVNNTWTVSTFSGNSYAYITNGSTKKVGESWLISPSFDFSTSSAPQFNFKTATFAANSALKVMISTDYVSGLPSTGTWTDITSSFAYSTGSWAWVSSGNFNLNAYKQANVHIAFKFIGTAASWDTWEVDNVKIIK